MPARQFGQMCQGTLRGLPSVLGLMLLHQCVWRWLPTGQQSRACPCLHRSDAAPLFPIGLPSLCELYARQRTYDPSFPRRQTYFSEHRQWLPRQSSAFRTPDGLGLRSLNAPPGRATALLPVPEISLPLPDRRQGKQVAAPIACCGLQDLHAAPAAARLSAVEISAAALPSETPPFRMNSAPASRGDDQTCISSPGCSPHAARPPWKSASHAAQPPW
mmetsp:Transcript_53143/g.95574  ORF Transcript_53143/g.95574 Transcript_53143/m.95574 type:complete len:217 (-) Transcript_53143:19-669(-)